LYQGISPPRFLGAGEKLTHLDALDPGGDGITEMRLRIVVDTLGKAVDREMGREETRVKVLAE
jgi:hypothetical protein